MRILILLAIAAQCVFAQGQLLVQNAAQEDILGALLGPAGSIAVGSFGTVRIAPGSLVRLIFLPAAGSPPVTDLQKAKVTIRATGSGQVYPARVLETSGPVARLIAHVPPDVPPGDAKVVLDVDGETSADAPIQLVSTSLAIFRKHGAANAQNTRFNGALVQNGLTSPVHPGEYVTLWATGLGAAGPQDVSVMLAGRPATVTYAGPAPGQIGVDQINLRVPDDARIPDACYLALSIRVSNKVADRVSISKTATADTCTHPLGFDRNQMSRLDAGGTAPLGSMRVSSSVRPAASEAGYIRKDSATGGFQNLDAAAIAARTGMTDITLVPGFASVSGDFLGTELFPGELDAGAAITLTSRGNAIDVPRIDTASFRYQVSLPTSPVADVSTLPDSVFKSGNWYIVGHGGEDIDWFSATVSIAPAIRLKTVPGAIDTAVDQVFEWNPAGYGDDDHVEIMIGTAIRLPFQNGTPRLVGVYVPARNGRVAVPASLLAQLRDPAAPSPVPGRVSISVSGDRRAQSFKVPMKTGETAPVAFEYSSSEEIAVELR